MTRTELADVLAEVIHQHQLDGFTARELAFAILDKAEPLIAHPARQAALHDAGRDIQALTVKAQMGDAAWVRVDHVVDLLHRRANA